MKPLFLFLAAVTAAAQTPYAYYQSTNTPASPGTGWSVNGTLYATGNGGSMISSLAVPDGTDEYEVSMTLSLTNGANGQFTQYPAPMPPRSTPLATPTSSNTSPSPPPTTPAPPRSSTTKSSTVPPPSKSPRPSRAMTT